MKRILIALGALALVAPGAFVMAACSQGETAKQDAADAAPGVPAALAGAGEADPTDEEPAGASAVILAWARGLHGDNLIEPVTILYGDFNGDGAADAFAWADFDTGGSSANHTAALFRNQNGRMTLLRTVDDVYGSEPRDARFSPGRIVLTTTMPKPDDPHCCPTGSQEWTVNTN